MRQAMARPGRRAIAAFRRRCSRQRLSSGRGRCSRSSSAADHRENACERVSLPDPLTFLKRLTESDGARVAGGDRPRSGHRKFRPSMRTRSARRAGFRAPAPCRRAGDSVRRLIFQPSTRAHQLPAVGGDAVNAEALGDAVVGHLVRLGGRVRREDLQIGGDDRACRRRSRCAAGPRNAQARRRSRPDGRAP